MLQKAVLKTSDNKLLAKEPLKLYIPKYFTEYGLAEVGADVNSIAYFAICTDTHYAVSMTPSMFASAPTQISVIKINDSPYYEFFYEKGAAVMKSTELVALDTLPSKIFDNLFLAARIPEFMAYSDVGGSFRYVNEYTGANLGIDEAVYRLMSSLIARDPNNRSVEYRLAARTPEEREKIKPSYVGMSSIAVANNTMARTSGAYFTDGVISALVHPSEEVEPLENILRQ